MDLRYLIRSGLAIPDYWHPYLELRTDFLSGSIGRYPTSMMAKAHYPGPLSDEGVPVVFLDGQRGILPVTVALYGLGNHEALLASGSPIYHERLLSALRWFEKHQVALGDGVGWPNEQDVPIYGLRAPWFSGLSQALASSLFVRADALKIEGRWAELARKTWLGYRVPVEAGGFRRDIGSGVIFEEYPGPQLDCAFSGMCHALVGLWESWRSGIVPEAYADFERGLAGLRACLPKFVHGRWSLYSLNRCAGRPLLASPYYQRSNGLLAEAIGLMAEDEEFRFYGRLWRESSESVPRRVSAAIRIAVERYFRAPELLHADKASPAKTAVGVKSIR